MALYKRIKSDEGIVIGVWKIEETLETLLSLYTEDKELQLLSESNLNNQTYKSHDGYYSALLK